MCVWQVTFTTEKRGEKEEHGYIAFGRHAHDALKLVIRKDQRYVISATVRLKHKNMSWEEYKAQEEEQEKE